ncbi:MAG: CoA transferase [Actinomycetota bacterium]|nr:CoA transferase [Acidimicrobiia bacterium]MDQ3293889.1 CoA transferase [Actinomycetota bacterium]
MRQKLGPLAGVRIIECSMLGPGAITTHLADLGADVIKVEPPSGDYIREMTWPWVEGVSLMHLHISRGKRSIVLDLRTEAGRATFLDLVRDADAVVEAMRPGGLARRGVGYDECRAVNPRIVFCTISGYGATGPYRDLPSHGIAYDTWAGLVDPIVTDDGFVEMPPHPNVGINVGPLFGALGLLAGVVKARETGTGCALEVAQSDAAAVMDWLAPETYKAYERPESEVTGNKSDGYARREPGTAGMKGGVRYQIYESADGHVLFMASEQAFWRNFCEGVGRPELFEAHPGSKYADHARGNTELRAQLRDIFRTRTTDEWIDFGIEVDTPIAPVHTPQTIADDRQFRERLPWLPREELGCEQLPIPLKFIDVELPVPTMAPTLGQDTDAVLADVLGYDDDTIAARRAAGAFGS